MLGIAREYTDRTGRKQNLIFRGFALNGDAKFSFPGKTEVFALPINRLSDTDAALLKESVPGSKLVPVNIWGYLGSKLNEGMTIEPRKPPPGYQEVDLSTLDPAVIPSIDQGQFGTKENDCVPSSMAMFLLWWDDAKVIPIPRNGDREEKADWLHTRLARDSKTRNNRGTSWINFRDGLAEYCRKELEGKYTLDLAIDYDYSPTNQSRWAGKGLATILSVSVYLDDRKMWAHAIALGQASPDGRATIITWGERVSGQWDVIKVLDQKKDHLPVYFSWPKEVLEFRPDDPTQLPEWWIKKRYRFVLDSREGDGLTIITPFARIAAGPGANP